MNYILKNDILTVTLCSHGAEIVSVKRGDCEYIWQADPAYWTGKAPLLFPVCGRLFGFKYTYEGKTYDLGNHGFARFMEFCAVSVTDDTVVFSLKANDETRACYPFEFELVVSYTLTGDKLSSHVSIKNTGDKTLPATFGCHPGFNVPLDGGSFEDYYLEFGKPCSPDQIEISPRGLFTGKKTAYRLQNGTVLPLSHKLFEVDGIFLSRMDSTVTLKSNKSTRSVTLQYPDMPYLGVWHSAKSEAPFVCIEPWCGLPGYDGEMEDINTRHDMFHILPGKTQVAQFKMTFGE